MKGRSNLHQQMWIKHLMFVKRHILYFVHTGAVDQTGIMATESNESIGRKPNTYDTNDIK